MPYYLVGFKDGYEVASWKADLFFPERVEVRQTSDEKKHLVRVSCLPPENVKLTHKQLAEHGFHDWLKTSANPTKPDYFVLRWYGQRP